MLAQQSNSHLKILKKFQMWMKYINRLYNYIYIILYQCALGLRAIQNMH